MNNIKKFLKQLLCNHNYEYVGGMYCKCTKCNKLKVYKL
jgi:hypothetical protein